MTSTVSFPALGTTATLAVVDRSAVAPARAELERELAETDAACSRFRSDSELSRVNRSRGQMVPVGERLAEAVAVALAAAEATGGLVDPTVGPSLRQLGYDRSFVLVLRRDPARLVSASVPAPGWDGVELDRSRRTLRLPPGTELDLGATAKALAADRGARAAAAAAGCGVLVSLGGDIAVAGEPPDGGWPVGIADDHRGASDTVVALRCGGLATSSTMVRRWHAGDVPLHHIVDPRTGRPAESPWRTVTVAAGTCVDANAASTAAIVAGADAPAWLETRNLPARLVTRTGARTYIGGWPEDGA